MWRKDKSVPAEIAAELVRQGEVRLNAILTTALAADARANALCSAMGAAGVAVCAAVLAEATSDHPVDSLIAPGLIAAVGLLVGAVICAIAGKPQSFRIPGGDPKSLRDWAWDGEDWRTEIELLDATAQRYAEAIAIDASVLERGSKLIHWALAIVLASIVMAGMVFLCLKGL